MASANDEETKLRSSNYFKLNQTLSQAGKDCNIMRQTKIGKIRSVFSEMEKITNGLNPEKRANPL